MLNIDIHAAARAAMYAATEMTDDECKGDYSNTPNVPTLAERREAMYERTAAPAEIPSWVIAQREEFLAAIAEEDARLAGFAETEEPNSVLGKYEAMRKYLTTGNPREPKARIRIVGNVSNNNGRRASLPGDSDAGFVRPWIIQVTMRNTVNFERYYLVRHMVTGEQRIVWAEFLHNLY